MRASSTGAKPWRTVPSFMFFTELAFSGRSGFSDSAVCGPAVFTGLDYTPGTVRGQTDDSVPLLCSLPLINDL